MQTLDDFMRDLPIKEHAQMMKKLVCDVPLSKNTIYGVRRGVIKISLATALKVFEITGRKADPRQMTKPDFWSGLDAYYQEASKRKRTRKS